MSVCCETWWTLLIVLPLASVPVIKKTWEKDAFFLEYYSDYADASIPTINLGVPNTERGKWSSCRQFIMELQWILYSILSLCSFFFYRRYK